MGRHLIKLLEANEARTFERFQKVKLPDHGGWKSDSHNVCFN